MRRARYKILGVPVARGLRVMLRFAAICKPITQKYSGVLEALIYRSKFNVALGVEAQRFCLVK